MKKFNLYTITLVMLFSCSQKKTTLTLFEKVENSGINFSNNITNTRDFNIFSYRNFYNGAGVAIGDINNDGLPDIFFTANMGPNKLYLNKGNFKFEDISEKAGFHDKKQWSTGVVMVDINHDNLLDIYVCNAGYQKGVEQNNQLWINKGDLRFEEKAADYGLNDPGFTTHAAFFDYDLDGDLDAYILNNSFIPVNTLNYSNKRDLRAEDWPIADFLKGGGDKLLRNDNGHFTDVSKEANIYGSLIGFGLGVTVGDVNNDRYPDIYVSNDFFERDYLYINQRNGTFKEDIENRIQHLSHSSMGADMADINNDGNEDVFVTEMLPDNDYRLKTTTSFENVDVQRFKVKSGFYNQYMQNTLQLNNGDGNFKEIAQYAGVAASDWSWGALMFDADNDGWNDIYICNGIYNDVTDQDFIDFFANEVMQRMVMTGKKEEIEEIINKMPSNPIKNKMFRNNGNMQFTDVGDQWGFTDKTFSNGAAYADLDNDGDLDLVVNNVNQPALVYKNNSREINKNHFTRIQLKGKDNNTRAIGSLVKVYTDSSIMIKELVPSRGFQSSVDYQMVFGLGQHKKIDSIVVHWPDQSQTSLVNPAMDTLLIIPMDGSKPAPAIAPIAKALFAEVPVSFDKHTEDDYVDFYTERNVPQQLSREGPRAAIADVNGDGLEDIYIGGTLKQAGQLYIRHADGFRKAEGLGKQLLGFEDISAVFFDADNDGDQDLFLGAGGNNKPSFNKDMQNRLYVNDGKGNFTISAKPLPKNMGNTGILLPYDIDDDGDLDVFAASRCMPANYGVTPESCIYINDGKAGFSLLSKEQCGPLAEAGMISGAAWIGKAGDKSKMLVVAGDWMGPRQFAFINNRFTEIQTNLSSMHGWWQTITAADLDGDGDDDLVLGNLGRNFYLKPDSSHPVKLWINAFSQNMMPEKIITRSVDGKDVPVFLKRELTDQIPILKKQNLKHQDYAKKSIQDLFDENMIKTSTVKQVDYTASCIAWNEGNGKYTIMELPAVVQLSSVNSILVTDINNDGKKDLLMGGNLVYWQPQFSRIDASYGHVMLNQGNRNWKYVSSESSGILVRGDVRDIKELDIKESRYFLFLRNNELPLMYSLNKK
jgi:enediyne biosynthesis protein E4